MPTKAEKAKQVQNDDRREKIAAQVESVIDEIFRNHPQLASIRKSMRRDQEPADQFASEFLRVFKQRLQG
jgi:hypothetical protein